MTWDQLRQLAETTMGDCRDSLATLESAYAQTEDAAGPAKELGRVQRLVVAYARLVAALRDYLEQERQGRRNPEKLAAQVDAFIAAAQPDVQDGDALRPSLPEAADLAARARRAARAHQ